MVSFLASLGNAAARAFQGYCDPDLFAATMQPPPKPTYQMAPWAIYSDPSFLDAATIPACFARPPPPPPPAPPVDPRWATFRDLWELSGIYRNGVQLFAAHQYSAMAAYQVGKDLLAVVLAAGRLLVSLEPALMVEEVPFLEWDFQGHEWLYDFLCAEPVLPEELDLLKQALLEFAVLFPGVQRPPPPPPQPASFPSAPTGNSGPGFPPAPSGPPFRSTPPSATPSSAPFGFPSGAPSAQAGPAASSPPTAPASAPSGSARAGPAAPSSTPSTSAPSTSAPSPAKTEAIEEINETLVPFRAAALRISNHLNAGTAPEERDYKDVDSYLASVFEIRAKLFVVREAEVPQWVAVARGLAREIAEKMENVPAGLKGLDKCRRQVVKALFVLGASV